jgi:hypothetical protein|tara:strand:- start:869 stop:1279 length:411 start_codon:yes stop_codon:yes gene_type:complete
MSITGTTGKYQDDVDALPELDITRYERMFKVFTAPSVGGKEFYYFNILNKMEFPTNIKSELLGLYTAVGKEPLTTTSNNIYGDITSWWLIYLANKDILSKQFYVKGGQQLRYILPSHRALIYQQITNSTIFDGRHF